MIKKIIHLSDTASGVFLDGTEESLERAERAVKILYLSAAMLCVSITITLILVFLPR